ncbi:MAG: dihydroorotate dehydrogenase electron transfer subunit [Candidatus Omnitrophica bacterium]|nr:dihydroorotate dehydrogenase electron transfer subunit [Candidatus Omnitrophota bacterium]
MKKFIHKETILTDIKKAALNIFLLTLEDNQISEAINPGQFLQLKIKGKILRRPFSIFSRSNNTIKILFRVCGEGTKILSEMKPQSKLDIIGPLGNGFPLDSKSPLFIAGGLGVAPLNFLANEIKNSGKFIYGTKHENEFVALSFPETTKHKIIKISEEKDKKNVCDILPEHLENTDTVYASGPRKMLKKVADICTKNKTTCFITWEERMGCGFGLCQSCAVKTRAGYKMTCADGPVFNINELDWHEH